MQPFTGAVVRTVRSIPPGKVMTYGGVARAAGNPRAARQVSFILHTCSEKYNLPWHRVINARGEISLSGFGADLQKQLLANEGVCFSGKQLELAVYLWQGSAGYVPD